MKYVRGGWLETRDDDTRGLGPCGGIGELLMLLGDRKEEKGNEANYVILPFPRDIPKLN